MHADMYFHGADKPHSVKGIGTVVPCEDYAIAGTVKASVGDLCYAVVTDGCSGARDSDFGARFLARSMVEVVRLAPEADADRLVNAAITRAMIPCYSLELPLGCLDATLVGAFCVKDRVRVVVAGDGVVVGQRRDGKRDVWSVEFPQVDQMSAPCYPSYLLDSNRLARYLSKFGRRQIEHYIDGALVEVIEDSVMDVVAQRSLSVGLSVPPKIEYVLDLPVAEYDAVMVFSDGVRALSCKGTTGAIEPVPVLDVIAEVADIPSHAGEFVIRSCRHFFTRVAPKRGWRLEDDFSMAAIWCGP